MQDFLRDWKDYLFGMWLGGSIPAVFGAGLLDWRFWVVVLPTVAMVVFVKRECADQE